MSTVREKRAKRLVEAAIEVFSPNESSRTMKDWGLIADLRKLLYNRFLEILP